MRTINYKTDLCGVAAALAARTGKQPRDIYPSEVRELLKIELK